MESKKPSSALGSSDNKRILLKVVDQDSKEIKFRIKRNTTMGKLKKIYCEQVALPVNFLRFLYDGKRIDDDATPRQLELEDEDIIEVYCEQDGGMWSG